MEVQGNPLDITPPSGPKFSSGMDGGGKRPSRYIKIAGVVAATLVIVAGGGYAGYRFSRKTEPSKPSTNNSSQTETKTSTEAPVTANTVYVTADLGLFLRSDPSASAGTLTDRPMPYGTRLEKEDTSKDAAWIKVTYQGKTGWCKAEFVSKDKPPLPDIHKADFVAMGVLALNSGTADPVAYNDFTGDGKDEAIVIVHRGNLTDYYVYGYNDYTLNTYLSRQNLTSAQITYAGGQVTEKSGSETTVWEWNGTEFTKSA